MTTILDIPEELLRKISLRAQLNGRDLQDEVTQLLFVGLANASPTTAALKSDQSRIEIDPETGFLVVHGDDNAPARHMTAAELIALEKESLEQEDLQRLGIPH